MSDPKDKLTTTFNPFTGNLDMINKFNPDRIVTDDRNAAGYPLMMFDPHTNTYMPLGPLVVTDDDGNVVTS